jgi:hypothetical protein
MLIAFIAIYIWEGLDILLQLKPLLLGAYFFLVIPSLGVYGEYILHDRQTCVIVNKELQAITIRNRKQEQVIKFEEVLFFETFGETKGIYWVPASAFSFGRIMTKKGEEIFITNLLKRKLHEIFPDVHVQRRRWIIPSISLYKMIRTNDDIPFSGGKPGY